MNWIRTGVLCLAAVTTVLADSIVVPGIYAATEGPSNLSIPFAWRPELRNQTVYNSSLFSSLSGPISITGINYRLDAPLDATFNQTIPDFQLRMSTTSRAAGNLSTTFADNVGPDVTLVRSGVLVNNHTAGAGPGPRPFNVSVSLQTPFVYDPTAGSLLLDYRVTGNTLFNRFYDGTNNFSPGVTSSDGISSVLTDRPDQATAAPLSCCPASDGTHPGGLIIQLQYEAAASPVPEPATLPLMGIVAAGTAMLVRRRRQSQAV